MCILIKSTDLIHISLGLLILSYVGISVYHSQDTEQLHIFLCLFIATPSTHPYPSKI